MLPDFYIGKYTFDNEVLYEGNITEPLETDYEVRKIENCCFYDISYQTIENIDTIEQVILFTIEVFCEVNYKNSQEVGTMSRKINAEKKLLISKNIIEGQMPAISDKYYVIQHIGNIVFCTQTMKNKSFYLTIAADVEGIFLREPHDDFWTCNKIDMAPPAENQVQDWKQLLNSISIKDMVSLFENFFQLVKGICNDEPDNKADIKELEQENMNLMNEINELKNRINNLKSEINSRSYIINGLLKIIKPL